MEATSNNNTLLRSHNKADTTSTHGLPIRDAAPRDKEPKDISQTCASISPEWQETVTKSFKHEERGVFADYTSPGYDPDEDVTNWGLPTALETGVELPIRVKDKGCNYLL